MTFLLCDQWGKRAAGRRSIGDPRGDHRQSSHSRVPRCPPRWRLPECDRVVLERGCRLPSVLRNKIIHSRPKLFNRSVSVGHEVQPGWLMRQASAWPHTQKDTRAELLRMSLTSPSGPLRTYWTRAECPPPEDNWKNRGIRPAGCPDRIPIRIDEPPGSRAGRLPDAVVQAGGPLGPGVTPWHLSGELHRPSSGSAPARRGPG
jgi:hypothetical protein